MFSATPTLRVHWMRNALSYVSKTQQSMVAAALRQAFIQPDRTQARRCVTWRTSCGRNGRSSHPSSTTAKPRPVASGIPRAAPNQDPQHEPSGTAEQGNEATRRRCRHIPKRGIDHPPDGAVLLEQNDEWQLQHRYMQVEAMAELGAPAEETETRQIAA